MSETSTSKSPDTSSAAVKPADRANPAHPAVHSDNDKSAVPDRADGDRDHAPNDPPGKKGEEPPVG